MIFQCKDCRIMISVSVRGYGDENVNPALLMFPDKFATKWMACGSCGAIYCDKCVRKRSGLFRKSKCDCGGDLIDGKEIYKDLMKRWKRNAQL